MPFPYTFPILFGGTQTPFDSATNRINKAAIELGLSPVVDPFTSGDPNFIQMCAFLESLGRDLWRKRNWTHLVKEYTFSTVADQGAYALPADFGHFVDNTHWDRTNQMPLPGPLNSRQWQQLKSRLAGVVVNTPWRLWQQHLYLYPDTTTPGDYTIAFEYVSRFWVQSASADAPDKDAPTAGSDIIWFDPQLVLRGLKLAWREAKGFDTTAEQARFDSTLEDIKGGDAPAPVLSCNGATDSPMLGLASLPITGFGGA